MEPNDLDYHLLAFLLLLGGASFILLCAMQMFGNFGLESESDAGCIKVALLLFVAAGVLCLLYLASRPLALWLAG